MDIYEWNFEVLQNLLVGQELADIFFTYFSFSHTKMKQLQVKQKVIMRGKVG